jgi:hypothetical protein
MDDARRFDGYGFRRTRTDPGCWEVKQIGPAATDGNAAIRRNPAANPAVLTWFNRLRDRKRPTPYQICLAMHIAAASRR